MSRRAARLTLAALAAALAHGEFDPNLLRRDPRLGARLLLVRWKRRRAREAAEAARLAAMFAHERAAWAAGLAPVAGVDEAGRGPLAGPVVAAAVVFPGEHALSHLRDSKTLSAGAREQVFGAITACGAWVGVGVAGVDEINRWNILGATRLAWARAIAALPQTPALVLLDGNQRAPIATPQQTLVKGDAACASIAAASVVAKVTRDRLMADLDRQFPQYGFASHKGYATVEHLAALHRFGPSPVHRRAFMPASLFQESLLSLP